MIRLLKFDALQLVRDRLAVGVLVCGLLACFFAVTAGMTWQRHLAAEHAGLREQIQSAHQNTRAQWADAQNKTRMQQVNLTVLGSSTTQLAPALLPDFTAGRSAIEPTTLQVRVTTRPDLLFTRYQIENPESLARGALDLGWVALVVAPLLLIGLGYGVFTSDRESGTARLWLAQAGSPLKLIAVRSINRILLVISPLFLAALVLWLAGPAGRGAAIASWLAVVLLVLMFWWAVILLVNSFRVGAETAALSLVGLWTLLVFAAPVVIMAAADWLHPPPSRFEAIAAARVAELGATNDYEDDHPEFSAGTPEARLEWLRKNMAVQESITAAVQPLETKTQTQFAAQRRLSEWLSFISPSLLAANALAGIAQTDLGTYAAQRQAVKEWLAIRNAKVADIALNNRRVDANTFDSIPVFAAPLPPAVSPWPMLWVLLLTVSIGAVAVWRLGRIKPL